MNSFLLIFVKNPRLGYVKTRLAHTLGDEAALEIYHILLEKTRLAALGVPVRRLLFYSEQIQLGDAWPASDFEKWVQTEGDLGARMQHAFAQAFQLGAEKVAIIGSDCPELKPEILQKAYDLLEQHDFVLGPTPDGGYYLLGMRQMEIPVFQDIAWSTEQVLTQTISVIEGLGKTYMLLPILSDIDTESDWRAYLSRQV
jgi:rSAM/selenodomain-associated transferase 1